MPPEPCTADSRGPAKRLQAPRLPTREALLREPGALLVVRDPPVLPIASPGKLGNTSHYRQPEPDIFVAVLADGRIMAFNGHVDLGTGIRTALAQVVAEELDVPFEAVTMVLGHTCAAPNQGPTVASATLQITAVPLRAAAAQARAWLHARAQAMLAGKLGGERRLRAQDGAFEIIDASGAAAATMVRYDELIGPEQVRLTLDIETPTKPASQYRIVGRSQARVDIPAKATGQLSFVHDVRLPGMLHGRVVRPPYAGIDCGDFVGTSLLHVDRASVADVPGLIDVVVIGDFVGVVAEREENAELAARMLKVSWKELRGTPNLDDLEACLRNAPGKPRPLLTRGDVDAARSAAAHVLRRTYLWPYQLHGSIGPSCSVARIHRDRLQVWSGTQNPHLLRTDLSRLMSMDEGDIDVIRMEASGCYGRNCADDVGGDAALLARAVGRPVRVQLSRQQEHLWEPKGSAQLVDVIGSMDAQGAPSSYELLSRYPTNDAPLLALLLTGTMPNTPRPMELGCRTSVPPYHYPHLRIATDDVAPIVRASWLRGVSALPNSFAHDSFIDELAVQAGADPLDYRLAHLPDARARELLQAVAERFSWHARATGSGGRADDEGWVRGCGLSYARYVHSNFPGFGAAFAAWAVELACHCATGRIVVKRVTVGQDAGLMVNPDGVRHQVHGNIVQMLSRVLKEEVRFDANGAAARDWGAYPLVTFPELPQIELVLMDRPDEPPLGSGESTSVPAPAAIANALFDATGKRFPRPPFTPERVRSVLLDRSAVPA